MLATSFSSGRSRWRLGSLTFLLLARLPTLGHAEVVQAQYNWRNVKVGGGGGFVPNIVFNQKEKGLAFARTDIGGTWKLNPADDTWIPLLDFVGDVDWNKWGSDAIATDPVDPANLYIAAGLYTNSWDNSNGSILKSTDRGNTFTAIPLPFKVGGNMPGRGMGERLAIDPNNNNILYFGARSGNGLFRSIDKGLTWSKVASFPAVGTYRQNPNDASGYQSDIMGISFVTFDSGSKAEQGGETRSARIFAGVASLGEDNLFVSQDGGTTWRPVEGLNSTFMPVRGILSPAERALYLTYNINIGPYDGTDGAVMKYFIDNSTWVEITPAPKGSGFGYGGLDVDLQRPGTVMVSALNQWWPDANIWRSINGGKTWFPLWTVTYPPPDFSLSVERYYNWDLSRAPWIRAFTGSDTKWTGWMIHGLSIDPFDSNHFLYGTGLSVWGSHDLLNWDQRAADVNGTRKNITLSSLADGMEMTAVLGLASPPGNYSDANRVRLVSALGDIGGFVHRNLSAVPQIWENPIWVGTATSVDFAGQSPSILVRLSGISGGTIPVAVSRDTGATWAAHAGLAASTEGLRKAYSGKVAINADAGSVVWFGASEGYGQEGVRAVVSVKEGAFAPVSGLEGSGTVVITADKKEAGLFFAAIGAKPFVSTNGGVSFAALNASLESAREVRSIAVNPMREGDVFFSTDAGVYRLSYPLDPEAAVRRIPTLSSSWAMAACLPPNKSLIPSLVVAGVVEGLSTLWRSDNMGVSWSRLTNSKVGLGATDAWTVACDGTEQGTVYVGTNGRGILVGWPEGRAMP